ncbi:MAG: spore germination protein [Bacilli bacterium]|nr:spore germination protein [Bacilli bacterium]MBO6194786.1 spore germination protein [Bacilli bacterium]
MNIEKLQEFSPDLKLKKLNNITIIFFETLCNSEYINNFILKPIVKYNINNFYKLKNKLPYNFKEIDNERDLFLYLYSGFTLINIKNKFIAVETKVLLDSGINEASNEKVIKGPKDAFCENYQSNIGLVRKRIKSPNLKIKEYIIGTKSKTKVSLLYIDDIVNIQLVNKLEKKLKTMNIDYVANSNYISENLTNNTSIFPINLTTERPDLVSFSLMEGRCAIIVENSPQALIFPSIFSDYIKNIDDYYQNNKNVSITRIIRILAFLIAIIVPGFYIALTTFNQETLPTNVLINFSMQREGVPFPSCVEAILLWLSFEILREADTRVPFVVGSSMSIVGALVLGQAAVDAGMISPIMIIIIAISSIASFLFNDNDIVNTIRIWKLIFLLLGSFVGLYGIFIGSLLFLIRISSIYSYGYDYTIPYAPFKLKEQLDNFILTKNFKFNRRNSFFTKNIFRR